MSAVLLGKFEPNSPEWDGLRARGLGGSEVAAIVGLSPWVSRFALYHRKVGTIGKQDVNTGMDWGNRLEPVVLDAFAERFPDVQRDVGGTWAHAERTWQIANPDALLNGEPVDAKTADKNDAWKWGPDGSDEIPPYYRCQLIHYGDVFGKHRGHIALLLGGNDFRTYMIEWTEDEAAWLRDEAAKFWQDVLDRNPPSIDGHTATYEAVREMHPEIDGTDVELDQQTYNEYVVTKTEAERWATEHSRAKATVLDAMGEARRALANGIPVLRRQQGRGQSISLQPIKAPKTPKEAA